MNKRARHKHAPKRLTIEKVNKILGLHLKGATQAEIVAATESSPNTIVGVLRSYEQVFSNIKELWAELLLGASGSSNETKSIVIFNRLL